MSIVKFRNLDVVDACSVSAQLALLCCFVVAWHCSLITPIAPMIASALWSSSFCSVMCFYSSSGYCAMPSGVFRTSWCDRCLRRLGWCAVAVEPVHHSACPNIVSLEDVISCCVVFCFRWSVLQWPALVIVYSSVLSLF